MAAIRRQVGPDFLIGATAKTLDQALAAQAAGADYLGVGACFPSPTKPNAKGITREALADICAAVSLPVVAIGGITLQNARQLQGVGMAGLAVISALFAARTSLRPPGTCWPCPDISRKEGRHENRPHHRRQRLQRRRPASRPT